MKDIDELLLQHPIKPTRKLSPHFTKGVIMGIQHKQKRSSTVWSILRDALLTHHIPKTGLAAFAVVALVGGTVTAAALWPRPEVTHTTSTPLASGSHIVGYDAQNCDYFNALGSSKSNGHTEKVYYEVRHDSHLTDEQIRASLQAICEENISNSAVTGIIKQLPKTMQGVSSTQAFRITNIDSKTITVSLDPAYDARQYTLPSSLTFTHFADDVQLSAMGESASLKDFTIGDTIKMVVRTSRSQSSETSANDNPLNHPETITVLGIVKVSPLTANPDTLYGAVGTELVRVEPCQGSATGYCRAYEFTR